MARIRSPNYPVVSLPNAITLTMTIHKKENHLAAPKEVVAKHLGYTSYHGLAKRMISAIEKYGLLEEVNGDKVRVSSLAMSILYPASGEEKSKAVLEAAYKPALFAAIKEEWQGSQPSDQNLRVFLIRRKFGSEILDRVIQIYRETMELVTQESSGYPASDDDAQDRSREPQKMPSTEKQFLEARTSTRFSGQATPTVTVKSGEEPYRLSLGPGGRLQGVFDLKNLVDAEEMIRAINAWKVLLTTTEEEEEEQAP
jgi:hypothetical protein